MTIQPLKQKFHHSCLVTSLFMISNMADQSIEERVFFEGEKRNFDLSLNSMLESFADNTMLSVEVFIDNKFFTDKLQKQQNKKNKRLKFKHEVITTELIMSLVKTDPVVVHIDNNFLGHQAHGSHYVVIENFENGNFQLIDPADGKCKSLKIEKMMEAISSLKTHLKICPIVIRKV